MPNKRDLPCAECGALMLRGHDSLPEGQAVCRPCRSQRSPEWRRLTRAERLGNVPHGTANGYSNYRCRCDACCIAWSAMHKAARERRKQAEPQNIPHGTSNGSSRWACSCAECRKAATHRTTRKQNRQNSESLSTAHRRGEPWTGPELEMVARTDLTAMQLARMLGRTRAAVQGARRRLEREPKYQILAGLSGEAT